MVGKSFGIPTILFYLASDADKNKREDDLNIKKHLYLYAEAGASS